MSMRITSVGPPAAGLTVPTMCRILIRPDRIARQGSGIWDWSWGEFAGDMGQRLAQAANVGFKVPGGDAAAGSFAHGAGLFGVGQNASKGCGQGVDIADRKDEALD